MVYQPPKLQKRQVLLGADLDGFYPEESSPADNFIAIGPGYYNDRSLGQIVPMAAQTAGPFALVTGALRERWDLLYLDATGTAAIEAGTEQAAGGAAYVGAPGNGAPFIADNVLPIAWVLVDEAGGVIVNATDITPVRGYFQNRTKGVVGSLATDDGSGVGGVLGTDWSLVPIDHQHPPNVDANLPADVTAAAPAAGVIDVYARRDHIHQLDATLYASLATPMDKGSSLYWTPRTDQPGGGLNPENHHWILHKFQGRAWNDASVWFNVNVGSEQTLELFPVDVGGLGGNIGLGASDVTDQTIIAFANTWLYVYLLGDPVAGTAALVYSTNKPSVGPNLAHAAFAVYTAWRVITCIEGTSGANGQAVPMCKYDNMVLKLIPTGTKSLAGSNVGAHVEDLYWNAATGVIVVSVAEHVSPLANAVFWNVTCFTDNSTGAGQSLAEAVFMGDTAAAIYPDLITGSDVDRKRVICTASSNANFSEEDVFNSEAFWYPLSELRTFVLNFATAGVGIEALFMQVLAYIEVNDQATDDFDYTL